MNINGKGENGIKKVHLTQGLNVCINLSTSSMSRKNVTKPSPINLHNNSSVSFPSSIKYKLIVICEDLCTGQLFG